MILKKPYAFLIKSFRFIHIILTVLINYLLYSTYNIYSFFSRYVENVYATLSDAVPSNYINIFMILISVLIIAFSLAMHLLMRKKEKPKTLYTVLTVYYMVYLVAIVLCFSLFKSLDSSTLSLKNAMIYRDVTLIFMLPQFIFVLFSLIRGLGFDIKKFNFSKDLKELNLSDSDNEEFEFVLGLDTYKYTRFMRKKAREFKYYVLENKFAFTILASLASVIFVTIIILNFTVYNKTFNEKQRINANNMILEINNSFLTNLNYKGEKISEDKYFLVVNISFTNNSGAAKVLDLTNYEIIVEDKKIIPTLSMNSHFVDLGAGYSKEKINNDSEEIFILVYELTKKQIKKSYILNIIDEIEYNAGTMNTKTKKIELTPNRHVQVDEQTTKNLNEHLTMYESVLNDSSLTINSFQFQNKYTFTYQACIRSGCSTKTDIVKANASKAKTLLILNGKLNLDANSNFLKNKKTSLTFFDAFVQIKYDGKLTSVLNVTPSTLTEQYILEVDDKVTKAKDIDLIITIRNKRYTINIK